MHEASDLVGVSQATLRRWSQAGDVEAFTTPGGHRRFTRDSLARLLPQPGRPRRTLRQLGETPERVMRHYRRELSGTHAHEFLPRLDDAGKEAFREPGRDILAGVLAYLDAPTAEAGDAALAAVRVAAATYGELAAANHLGVSQTVTAFLHFRAPFLDELAVISRRRRLDTDEALALLTAATTTFDRLLPALLDSYLAAGKPARRSGGDSIRARR
jgi:excisionase family DNA binding protein